MAGGWLALASALAFASGSSWDSWVAWTSARDPNAPATHVAEDRRSLAALSATPANVRPIFVLGSSRAAVGFRRDLAARLRPKEAFVALTHEFIDPFVMRSLAGEIGQLQPKRVVLLLSDFDTHRPVRLEPLPDIPSAGLGPITDLATAAGPGFVLRNRHSFLRLLGSTLFPPYRYRQVVRAAGPEDWFRFASTLR